MRIGGLFLIPITINKSVPRVLSLLIFILIFLTIFIKRVTLQDNFSSLSLTCISFWFELSSFKTPKTSELLDLIAAALFLAEGVRTGSLASCTFWMGFWAYWTAADKSLFSSLFFRFCLLLCSVIFFLRSGRRSGQWFFIFQYCWCHFNISVCERVAYVLNNSNAKFSRR